MNKLKNSTMGKAFIFSIKHKNLLSYIEANSKSKYQHHSPNE